MSNGFYIDYDFDDLEDCLLITSAQSLKNCKVISRDQRLLQRYPQVTLHPDVFFSFITEQHAQKIPFFDFSATHREIAAQIEYQFDTIFKEQWYILGMMLN
jgi:hypothetical protein